MNQFEEMGIGTGNHGILHFSTFCSFITVFSDIFAPLLRAPVACGEGGGIL